MLAKLSIHTFPFMKDVQERDNNKMQHLFNESLIKVNSSTVAAALRRRQSQALGDMNCLLFFSAEDSD